MKLIEAMEKEYYKPIVIKNNPKNNSSSKESQRIEQKQLPENTFPGYKKGLAESQIIKK